MSEPPRFMNVRQVAAYLNINPKKVYALAAEGSIPGTRITGKWTFPKELVDRWLLTASHSGLLSDRLILVGADDPLLYRIALELVADSGAHALLSYTGTGTRLGLELLASHRADVCAIHWGPAQESGVRHPALCQSFSGYRRWVLVHVLQRQQGLITRPRGPATPASIGDLLAMELRWVHRQPGSGSGRFLQELLSHHAIAFETLGMAVSARSAREAASAVAMGLADIAPGTQASAREFGLAFHPGGWEALDFVLDQGLYFRNLFRHLLERLQSADTRTLASRLGGYDLSASGTIVWSGGE